MPLTLNPFHARRYPMWMLVLLPIGALLIGSGFARLAAPNPGTVTLTHIGTRVVTSTRTVKRVVHGKVVTHNEDVYVQVPVIVVHTDHHVIRVPQHLLPLRSASATIANPLVTIYVQVPVTTYVPTTITETATSTETVPTTITITLPLAGDDPTI